MAEKLNLLDTLKLFKEQMDAKYAEKYANKSDIPTVVSALQNDSKYQTEEQVNAKIDARVTAVYRAGGSVAFEDLPELLEDNLGLVVNITNAFTTTDFFVDGAGLSYPAGTNVAVVASGEDYKYDAMSGMVDLSALATTASVDEKLTAYVKTSELDVVTREEILALFAENVESGEENT